ncbi:MAG TPA: Eco57I restriction-modification methylase domain-containing protein, partial [Candidatus Magasanikbacteria bacterium]|nr:Eco57I restriction-modification methylase domain-containing protein [Candidatus Magasanikbacteria bacterium]
MKFDVIIGNPPYQMSFGIEGANSSNAKSIYNLFISQAIKLNPRYLTMITPSRWMTKTSQGIPGEWVDNILKSNKFRIIHDFENSADCFPGVSIMGGVSYFLWEKDYTGKCEYHFHNNGNQSVSQRYDYLDSTQSGIVIRDPRSYGIIDKIIKKEGKYFTETNNNFSGLVSPKHFFDNGILLTSNWKDFKKEKQNDCNVKYYLNKNIFNADFGWIAENQIPKNVETKNLQKVYIPAANGSQNIILGNPFYGEAGSICSQTYLVIGYDPQKHNFSKQQCLNIISYIKTRFFRYLVSIKKKTQNGPRGVYQFVPLQDFSESWTDEKLYKKYKLTKEEIDFIESMIRPMN